MAGRGVPLLADIPWQAQPDPRGPRDAADRLDLKIRPVRQGVMR
jgi:hypothetical protein